MAVLLLPFTSEAFVGVVFRKPVIWGYVQGLRLGFRPNRGVVYPERMQQPNDCTWEVWGITLGDLMEVIR